MAQECNLNFEKQIGKKYSQGSYRNYKITPKYLIEFVPICSGKKDMPLKSLNFKFCEACFNYLTRKKTCHVNGANIQIQRTWVLNTSAATDFFTDNLAKNYTNAVPVGVAFDIQYKIFYVSLKSSGKTLINRNI